MSTSGCENRPSLVTASFNVIPSFSDPAFFALTKKSFLCNFRVRPGISIVQELVRGEPGNGQEPSLGARTRGDDLAGDEPISAQPRSARANQLKIIPSIENRPARYRDSSHPSVEHWLSLPRSQSLAGTERKAGQNALSRSSHDCTLAQSLLCRPSLMCSLNRLR